MASSSNESNGVKKDDFVKVLRPRTPYILFTSANRKRIVAAHPDAKLPDVARLLSAEWKVISADEKKKYEVLAEEDKKRYAAEIVLHPQPKRVMKKKNKKSKDEDSDEEDDGKKKKKSKKNAKPRPLTAWLHYVKENRAAIQKNNPSLSFAELGRLVAKSWKELNDKSKYVEMAKKSKADLAAPLPAGPCL